MRIPALATLALLLVACAPQGPSTPGPSSTALQVSSASSSASSLDNLIQVTSPTPNQTVSSPLSVIGRARGQWYFEASFPVQLLDSSNNVIAQGIAQAQSDWMTTNFVPFVVTLSNFTATSGTTGTLVLHKSNASGEPQNDASISIPVNF